MYVQRLVQYQNPSTLYILCERRNASILNQRDGERRYRLVY